MLASMTLISAGEAVNVSDLTRISAPFGPTATEAALTKPCLVDYTTATSILPVCDASDSTTSNNARLTTSNNARLTPINLFVIM